MIIEGCKIFKKKPKGTIRICNEPFTDENDTDIENVFINGRGYDVNIEVHKRDKTRFYVVLKRWRYSNLQRILDMLYDGKEKPYGNAFDKAFRFLENIGGNFGRKEVKEN